MTRTYTNSVDPVRALTRPLLDDNPIAVQLLGICSALAITRTLAASLTMSLALICVLTVSNAVISAIRNQVPRSIRLIVQITIIASLVIVADQVLQAYAYEMSRELSVFVGLIITNCIVLGRAEGHAMHNGVWSSVLDGLGNGLGYALIMILVGGARELLGAGSLLGRQVLPLATEGGWFQPLGVMQTAPSAFFVIGLLSWVLHSRKSAHSARHAGADPAAARSEGDA